RVDAELVQVREVISCAERDPHRNRGKGASSRRSGLGAGVENDIQMGLRFAMVVKEVDWSGEDQFPARPVEGHMDVREFSMQEIRPARIDFNVRDLEWNLWSDIR